MHSWEPHNNGPTIVKKRVETIITEKKPIFDESALQRQKDLEFELSQLEHFLHKKDAEIETFQRKVQVINSLEYKIHELENENASLRNQISEILREVEILRGEKDTFMQKNQVIIDQKTQEINILNQKLKEFEGLPSQLSLARQNIGTLSEELNRVSSLLKQRDVEIERVTTSFREFESENKTLKTKFADFEKMKVELDQLRDLQLQVTRERDELVKTLSLKENEITSLKQELAKLANAPKVSEQELLELTNRNKALTADMAMLKNEISIRDKKIEEMNLLVTNMRSKEPSLRDSLNAAIRERDELSAKLAALQKEFDPIVRERDSVLALLHERDLELSEATKTLHEMAPELERAGERIFALETELNSQRSVVTTSYSETEKYKSRITELESMVVDVGQLKGLIDKLTKERDNLLLVLKDRDVQIETLRKDFDRLSNELRVRGGELEALRQQSSDVMALEKELKARDRTIGDLYLRIEEWKTKEKSLSESVRVLSGEKDNLLAQLEALRAELSQIAPERERLLASLKNKEEQIVALNAGLSKLTFENGELRNVLIAMEKNRDGFEELLKERDLEVDRLKQAVLELESMRKRVSTFDSEIKRHTVTIKKQETEIVDLRRQVQQISELESRIKALTIQNAELRDQIGSFENLRAEVMQLRQLVNSLTIKRDNLLALLQERDNELRSLRSFASEYESLKMRYAESTKEIQRLNGLLAPYEARLKELEAFVVDVQEIERNQRILFSENSRLAQDKSQLLLRLQELERTLSIISTKYRELEDNYLEIRDAADELGHVREKLVHVVDQTERVDSSVSIDYFSLFLCNNLNFS